MPNLVYIGGGRKTHLRADGGGAVPAGRARCEITNDGKTWLYRDTDGARQPDTASATRPTDLSLVSQPKAPRLAARRKTRYLRGSYTFAAWRCR